MRSIPWFFSFGMGARVIKKRFNALKPHLDERMRRLVAAAEAKALGHGGISAVSRATGLSRNTVARGMEELEGLPAPSAQRTRRSGGGRKREVEKDPTLMRDLEGLMEPRVRGEPASSLTWTCKGLRRLADELKERGHTTSHRMVGELLHHMGYRLQSPYRAPGGLSRMERHAGFERIHRQVERFHRGNLPVIAVEMKKRERRDRGTPGEALLKTNGFSEWAHAAADRTTCDVAVESIRRWWMSMGSQYYPESDALLVTAEGAGSGLYRSGHWEKTLQGFSDAFGLSLTVLRFPNGMHKWIGIEGRTVSRVRQERHPGLCTEHEVIVNWIAPKAPAPLWEAPHAPGLAERGENRQNGTKTAYVKRDDELGVWGFSLAPVLRKMH
jgi:transposase